MVFGRSRGYYRWDGRGDTRDTSFLHALHHRQKVSRLSTTPRDEPSTLQVQVPPQQHRELQGGVAHIVFTRCCGCGGEDVFPLNACIAVAFPKGPRERPIRFSLPSKASAGGPPRPHPCKSCKSLRTRPSSKKNARRVKRRPHNRPRHISRFIVLYACRRVLPPTTP